MIKINGQELFSCREFAEMKNFKIKSLHENARRKNVRPIHIENRTFYYSLEQLNSISIHQKKTEERKKLSRKKRVQKNYYRVSRYDNLLNKYIIVACGLSRKAAYEMANEIGGLCVVLNHKEKLKF
jgi:hypothetical protein